MTDFDAVIRHLCAHPEEALDALSSLPTDEDRSDGEGGRIWDVKYEGHFLRCFARASYTKVRLENGRGEDIITLPPIYHSKYVNLSWSRPEDASQLPRHDLTTRIEMALQNAIQSTPQWMIDCIKVLVDPYRNSLGELISLRLPTLYAQGQVQESLPEDVVKQIDHFRTFPLMMIKRRIGSAHLMAQILVI